MHCYQTDELNYGDKTSEGKGCSKYVSPLSLHTFCRSYSSRVPSLRHGRGLDRHTPARCKGENFSLLALYW